MFIPNKQNNGFGVPPPPTWLVATEEEDLSERVRHGKKGGFLRSCTVSKQSWMMMVQVRRRSCVIDRRAVCALQFHLSVNSPLSNEPFFLCQQSSSVSFPCAHSGSSSTPSRFCVAARWYVCALRSPAHQLCASEIIFCTCPGKDGGPTKKNSSRIGQKNLARKVVRPSCNQHFCQFYGEYYCTVYRLFRVY